jgi:uncharacterized protein (DUF433 family)
LEAIFRKPIGWDGAVCRESTVIVNKLGIARRAQLWQKTCMGLSTDIGSMITASPGVKQGAARIAGTGVTVRTIARWHQAGLGPEEIVLKFENLKLEQVHAALAYYFANRSEIEAAIAEQEKEALRIESQARSHPGS